MSRVTPCVRWVEYTDLPDDCDTTAIAPAVLDHALTFASDIMFNLTRRRWPGLCTDTIRPLVNCTSCWLTGCANGAEIYHSSIKLPAIDVRAITEVKVDGAVVDPAEYRLRGNWLMAARQADGTLRSWPCYNDLTADASADDTFQVAYTHGADPPASGVRAAALLAWEFALSWTPACSGSCRLPQRVTTITRAGTTFAIIDPLTVFKDGLTGVPDIDMLISALNRGETHQRAFVGRPGSKLNRVSR